MIKVEDDDEKKYSNFFTIPKAETIFLNTYAYSNYICDFLI